MLWLTKRSPSENHADDETDDRANLDDGETENYNDRLAKAGFGWSAGPKDHRGDHQPQQCVCTPGRKQNPTRQSHYNKGVLSSKQPNVVHNLRADLARTERKRGP